MQPALTDHLILDGPGFRGSRMAPPVITGAPLVGEHTREICRDLLGMPGMVRGNEVIDGQVAFGAFSVKKGRHKSAFPDAHLTAQNQVAVVVLPNKSLHQFKECFPPREIRVGRR